MTYQVVFDVRTAGPSGVAIAFFVIGIVVLIVAITLVRRPELMAYGSTGKLATKSPPKRPWRFLAFASLFAFFTLAGLDGGRAELKRIAERDGCTTIEGPVADYILQRGGKPQESFSVGGVHFEYKEFVSNGAFNDTAQWGGPIKPGLQVRVCYLASEKFRENLILKLEVAP